MENETNKVPKDSNLIKVINFKLQQFIKLSRLHYFLSVMLCIYSIKHNIRTTDLITIKKILRKKFILAYIVRRLTSNSHHTKESPIIDCESKGLIKQYGSTV